MLGPQPGINFGGIQSSHDSMCVHGTEALSQNIGWSYYGGPEDTSSPDEAFPHWKQDDPSLRVRCVPRHVNIDTRRVSDPGRAEVLRNIYKQNRGFLVQHCGEMVTNHLNMDVWKIKIVCGGACGPTDLTFDLIQGQADMLVFPSRDETDLSAHCLSCPKWARRLTSTSAVARWSTVLDGREMNLYCVLVGYTDYVSINVKVDSSNIIRATPDIYLSL